MRPLIFNVQHQVFRLRADTELTTPNTYAGADVVVRLAFGELSKGILIDGIGDPVERPYLSVMGVAGKLEVDAVLLCFL